MAKKPSPDSNQAAILVAETKLHLATVMNGQYSEPFFANMCKIIDLRIYTGYVTLRGKSVSFTCVKDFLYNFHYGLGITDMPGFLHSCAAVAIRDRSSGNYAQRFIEWLQLQDPIFCFPKEFFKYLQLRKSLIPVYRKDKRKGWQHIMMLREIYNHHPEFLNLIGESARYQDIEECYYGEGLGIKPEYVKIKKIEKDPSFRQVERLASDLHRGLPPHSIYRLIAKLVELREAHNAKRSVAN